MNKFLIIDGNSLIYRAYYALPFLSNSKGQYTGAIFGFLNMFTKVLEEYNPTHVVVAFDFAHKTFRNDIFKDYKGTRKPTPPELVSQFPILKKILKAMGIVCLEQEGIEADDIIGTLSKISCDDIVILSGDRDVLQLIDNHTSVWLTKKGISEIYKVDLDVLLKDTGLEPVQIIDLKALMGDTSDNIPGVKGIGPKTATNLITIFKNIETLYESLQNTNLKSLGISEGIKNKLISDKDNAFMSKQLATIKRDCSINVDFDTLKLNLPFSSACIELLREYDFNSLLKKQIFNGNNTSFNNENLEKFDSNDKKQIIDIKNFDELSKIITNNSSCQNFAISIEKDLKFSFNSLITYHIKNEINFFDSSPSIEEALSLLKPFLENANINKIVLDLKNILHILDNYNVKLNGNIFDLRLATYLISGGKLNVDNTANFFDLKKEFIDLLASYNMTTLYSDIEIPLVYVLYDMEKQGFKLNVDELNRLSNLYEEELIQLTNKIYSIAGEVFNINSPKQLGEILFDKLNISTFNNKKHSTGFDILSQIEDEHEIIPLILRYRKIQKLKSTYLDAYKNIILKNGDIIHTVFNQMLTSTGRLSSSEPNLQNIPVRDEEGRSLRKMFISRFDNGQIVGADYNQIELRLLAHFSGDKTLIEAFQNNKDIHKITASQIFGIKEEDVTQQQRRDAKAVNFGIIYGISDFGLSNNVGISRKSAKLYIEKYFEKYPNVRKYMDNNIEFAKKNGYISTIFNRRRKIPEINSNVHFKRMFGERVAMNMPLQGSASDIIKLAMIKVFNNFNDKKLKSKLVLQIHDELIVDAHPDEIDLVKNILRESMENVIKLKVPLIVQIDSGKTWYDA